MVRINFLGVLVVLMAMVMAGHGAASEPPRSRGLGKQLFAKNYCPLCDSSVYSYCHHKLHHDACCCTGQFGLQGSFQCLQTDCRYLHANSCREFALIAECCCDD